MTYIITEFIEMRPREYLREVERFLQPLITR